MKISILIALQGLIFFSCSTAIKLNPGARTVKVVKYLPSALKARYDDVDMLECKLGMNGRSKEKNIAACKNDFKNKAAVLNADIVEIKGINSYRSDAIAAFGNPTGYCANCVEMSGIAYRKKSSVRTRKK